MNYPIVAKKLSMSPHLRANKKGFISIYALVLLSVVLLFSFYMSQRILTYAKLRSSDNRIQMLDIYIANHVRTYLKKDQSPPQSDDSTPVMEEGTDEIEASTTWQRIYQNFTLHFEEMENEIKVQYSLDGIIKNICITFDTDTKEIKDYAYVG